MGTVQHRRSEPLSTKSKKQKWWMNQIRRCEPSRVVTIRTTPSIRQTSHGIYRSNIWSGAYRWTIKNMIESYKAICKKTIRPWHMIWRRGRKSFGDPRRVTNSIHPGIISWKNRDLPEVKKFIPEEGFCFRPPSEVSGCRLRFFPHRNIATRSRRDDNIRIPRDILKYSEVSQVKVRVV